MRLNNVAPTVSMAFHAMFLLQMLGQTSAMGSRFSKLCEDISCFSLEDYGPIQYLMNAIVGAPAKALPANTKVGNPNVCPNPDAPKEARGWRVWSDTDDSVPTVEDILADIETCGVLAAPGAHALFYSYGGGGTAARAFKAKEPDLKLRTINDLFPESWYDALRSRGDLSGMKSTYASDVMVARNSQAMAMACQGDVYLIAAEDKKLNDPDIANIYTVPYLDVNTQWRGRHNVWFDFEFWKVQENERVPNIFTVRKTGDDTFKILDKETTMWSRQRDGHNEEKKALMREDANEYTIKIFEALKARQLCPKPVPGFPDGPVRGNSPPLGSTQKRAPMCEAWPESLPHKQPSTKQPGTKQPSTKQPDTKQPGNKQPGTKQPGTKQPGTKQPGSKQPSLGQAGPGQANRNHPANGHPSGRRPVQKTTGKYAGQARGSRRARQVQS